MKQRVWGAFLIVVLVAALVAGPVGAVAVGSSGPWAALVGPAFARFVPGTAEWDLQFGVVGDGWGTAQPKLVAVKAVVDGRACGPLQMGFTGGSWAVASGWLTLAEVNEVTATRLADAQGIATSSASLPRLEDQAANLAELLGQAEPGTLSLSGMESLPAGSHDVQLNLTYDIGGKTVVLAAETVVLLAALPPSNGWYPADLHMHSKYSDADPYVDITVLRDSLASRGYSIGYVTDHTEDLITHQTFGSLTAPYPAACRAANTATISMFPGVELGVTPDGHALGYGVTSVAGMLDNVLPAQTGLDTIVANSPMASAGIAHPGHVFIIPSFAYPWVDQTSVNYSGIEVMSGNQYAADFSRDSLNARFWRAQCLRRLLTSEQTFIPSVRAGSDLHSPDAPAGGWQDYVTYVQLPAGFNWSGESWDNRWAAVNSALKNGRTVVSRKGSLAYLTLDGSPVGSFLTRAAGSLMTFNITFRPVDTGPYTLTLYRDDCAEEIQTWAFCPLTAGAPLTFSASCAFGGGRHYYWLYVEGFDYCYTTPIYVTASAPATGSARIDSHRVSPKTAGVGQPIAFDVYFTNTGSDTRTFGVCLTLRGPSGQTVNLTCHAVTVLSGSQGHASWGYTPKVGEEGSWDAVYGIWNEPSQVTPLDNTGWQTAYFTVPPSQPPSLRIDSHRPNPATAGIGQPMSFDLYCTNTGAVTTSYAVSLTLRGPSGQTIDLSCYTASLASGAPGYHYWTHTPKGGEDGSWDANYRIWTDASKTTEITSTGWQTAYFMVPPSQPPPASLRIDIHRIYPAVVWGQPTYFHLFYTNTGSATATFGVSLTLRGPNGQTVDLPCNTASLVPDAQSYSLWSYIPTAAQAGSWDANYRIWTDASKTTEITSTGWQTAYFTVQPPPPPPPPPATLRIDSYSVRPAITCIGHPIFFELFCTNTGAVTMSTLAVSLTVRGPSGQTIDLWPTYWGILAPGERGYYDWSFAPEAAEAGSWDAIYRIWADGSKVTLLSSTGWQTGYFTVLASPPPASLRFDSHRAYPTAGFGTVCFDLYYTNTGSVTETFGVSLTLRGPSGQTVDLGCYACRLLPGVQGKSFWVYYPRAGDDGSWDALYTIWNEYSPPVTPLFRTGWQTGYFMVLPPEPPTPPSARIDSHRASPTTAGSGQAATFELWLTNTGAVTWTFISSPTLRSPSGQLVRLPDQELRVGPGNPGAGVWTYTPTEVGVWGALYEVWKDSGHTVLLATSGWQTAYLTVRNPLVLAQTGGSTVVAEGGAGDTYTVALATQPTAQVTVTLAGDQQVTALNATGGTTLAFGPGNWNVPQNVFVTAVDDAVVEGQHSGTIRHTPSGGGYDGLSSVPLGVSVTDNDVPTIVFTETGGSTAVLEGPPGAVGATDAYALCLGAQPSGQVTVTATPDIQVMVDNGLEGNTLVFTLADWNVPQVLTVRAVDDGVVEGPHLGRIRHTATGGAYDGARAIDLGVSITDNDLPTIVIAETVGSTIVTEGGASDTYTVCLGAQPSGPVTITATPDSQVAVSNGRGGNTLTFTTGNWSTPQTMTVRAVDDTLLEGLHVGRITHAASGGAYGAAPAVALWVAITDNDRPSAPSTLTARTSADGVHLGWLPPPGATIPTGYEVYMKLSSTGTVTKLKDISIWEGEAPNCEVTALDLTGTGLAYTPGRTYYFQVKAYVDLPAGPRIVSQLSNTASAVAGPIPPLAPASLAANSSADGVRLNWLAPSSGVAPQGYDVYVATASTGPFTTLAKTVKTWEGLNPSCEVTGADLAGTGFTFSGGRTYYFQVKSYFVHSIAGRLVSLPSNTAFTVAGPIPPLPPRSLTGTATATGLRLGWLPALTGCVPQGYQVFIAPSSTGPFTLVKEVTSWTGTAPNCEVTQLDFADGAGGYTFTLTGGKRYAFQVRGFILPSVGGKPTSGPSNTATVTAGPLPPGAPTGLAARTTLLGVGLGWRPPLPMVTAPTPPTGYSVYIAVTSLGPWTFVKDVTTWTGELPNTEVTGADLDGTGFTMTGGLRYSFRVFSFLNHPLIAQKVSSLMGATTMGLAGPLPPLAPTSLRGTTGADGFGLTWLAPLTGVTPQGYEVWMRPAAATTAPLVLVKDVLAASWSTATPSCGVTSAEIAAGGLTYAPGARYSVKLYAYALHPATMEKLVSARWAVSTVTAGPLPPQAPTGLVGTTALPASGGGVNLTWKPPTMGAVPAGYAAHIAAVSTGPYTFVKNVTSWPGTYPSTQVTVGDCSAAGFTMTAGVRYYFRVYSFIYHPVTAEKVPSLRFASANAVAAP